MKKIIFVGGKGGVGKTTCASSIAFIHSKKNKVLLVSTDPAHSTSDLFDIKIKQQDELYKYSENLDIMEIDGEKEAELYLSKIKRQCNLMLSPVIMGEIQGQLNKAKNSPGTYESSIFEKINKIITGNQSYDYIIFDTAPTGHTLHLINLPKSVNIWMNTLIKKRRKILMLKNMKFKKKDRIEDDRVLDILEKRRDNLVKISEILGNPKIVSFYFVMNPEKLSFLETKRGIKSLEGYGIKVDKIIINRVYPDSIDEFWQEQKNNQQKFIEFIRIEFSGR
ncbi:TRC40/GET3/ArsA family transport-energizing ATPase [Psychrilyobacter sp.]|uniref:ArsA family ATPase n=1 Tax=Psychrilyobacter sp. TaxID=2586924 RepID=UPI0030197F38